MSSAHTIPRHLREVLRDFPQASARRTGGGHWAISSPAGPIFASSSPSDHRAIENLRASLRRAYRRERA